MSPSKKPGKSDSSTSKVNPPKAATSLAGDIKQGTIAKFMRKRTQLVGFETGLNKHTQYSIEFLDNAIDALESWWWKTKSRPRLADSLDSEIVDEVREKLKEGQIDSIALSKQLERDVRAGKEVEIPVTRKDTLDDRVTEFRKLMAALRPLLNKREPLAIMQLTEVQMPDLVPIDDEEGFKVYEFTCFEDRKSVV